MQATAGTPEVGAATGPDTFGLIDRIVRDSRVARGDAEHQRARALVAALVGEVMAGSVVVSDNLSVAIDARIAEIDALLVRPAQRGAAPPRASSGSRRSWSGLHYLLPARPRPARR
ncbi:MAG: hypothetical protein MZW92_55360 [Comamonadaceae bacterium]|nr:hypothetical protein [Comamonadaceae bacterium]